MSFGGGSSTPPEMPEYKAPPALAPEVKFEEDAVEGATEAERRRNNWNNKS